METWDNRGGLEHPVVMQDKHKLSVMSIVEHFLECAHVSSL